MATFIPWNGRVTPYYRGPLNQELPGIWYKTRRNGRTATLYDPSRWGHLKSYGLFHKGPPMSAMGDQYDATPPRPPNVGLQIGFVALGLTAVAGLWWATRPAKVTANRRRKRRKTRRNPKLVGNRKTDHLNTATRLIQLGQRAIEDGCVNVAWSLAQEAEAELGNAVIGYESRAEEQKYRAITYAMNDLYNDVAVARGRGRRSA